MNNTSAPVVDQIKDDNVRQLASAETILRGRKLLAQSGEVMFGALKPDLIEAKVRVADDVTEQVRFEQTNGQLTWHCTCTDDPKFFCEHLVAAALDAQRELRGDIYKAAGIILKDRKMLVERSVGKPVFIAPGGRMQPGESPAEALIRELKEELQITVDKDDLDYYGLYSAEAANHPGQQVHMHVFLVKKWARDITPNNEVEELKWVTSKLPTDFEVGSIFGHEVLPRLKEQGLVD